MVRPAFVVAVVAVALPARAGQLPHRIGMYPTSGAALAMLDSKIAVHVRGPIVEAQVTQTFRNDTDHATEATYVFPLPDDAAVSAMAIQSGARTIHAAIARREDAQRRYEEAVMAGVGAGLLDQERPDVFTQTVSAIPAHGTVSVTLRYDATARFVAGTWELALPLVIAPRYVPGAATGRPTTGTGRAPDTDRAPDASRVTPGGAPGAGGKTEVTLEIDGGSDVTSPTHELGAVGHGFAFADAHSDHDAIVRWHAPTAAWVEQDDDGGYAAVLVEAPPSAARSQPIACTLVVDRSATMHGDADAVEHPIVRALVGTLAATDSVAILGGIRHAASAPDQALRAVDATWEKAVRFDLSRALGSVQRHGPVVVITDGLVADDQAALAEAARIGGPVHVIGVGPAPNRSLLTHIASSTGGTVRFATVGDDVSALARDVVADLAAPPQAPTITWGTLAPTDVVPATLPRLGAGQAVLVVARVKQARTATARVHGDLIGFTMVTPPRALEGATTPRGALGRRWARLELDDLIATGNPAAVAEHALRYGLVSSATSLVAIGEEVVVTGGVKHTVAVPVSVPDGMPWELVHHETTVDVSSTTRDPANKVSEKKTGHREADRDDGKPMKKSSAKGFGGGDKVDKDEEAAKLPKPAKAASDDDDDDDAYEDAKSDGHRRDERKHSGHKRHADGDADSTSASGADVPPAAPATPAPVATSDLNAELSPEAEEVIVTSGSLLSARNQRWSISAGAGVAVLHGGADEVTALTGRFETATRTALGLEGALWLVDGLHLQGDVLATIARRGLGPLTLGTGVGLHFGPGAGPAVDLSLRTRLPLRHVGAYLRYDGALLFHDGTRDGQNVGTAGVEVGF